MKKRFLAVLFSIAMTVALCGCAQSDSVVELTAKAGMDSVDAASERQQGNGNGMPSDSENKADASEPAVGTDTVDLTSETGAEIAIDYAIRSYAPVQDFGYRLFLGNIDGTNPVLSPVSAYLALSMAGFGADGTTREAFLALFGDDMEVFSDDMMNTLPRSSEDMTISLANSAWLDDQLVVSDEWVGTVKSLADAQVYQAKLSTADVMASMNKWIKENTNGLIDQMIEEPLDESTRLVLFNTIYFKAKWAYPFEGYETREREFMLEDGGTVQAQMMQNELHLDYLSNDEMEGVILPYRDGQADSSLAFIALKPKSPDQEIREACDALTREVISDILVNKQDKLVNLRLPKFTVTYDKNLNESLINLGLGEAFDAGSANFDQISQSKDLYISLVRQKAKVIVDEEGTEAAAVTEVAMNECALVDPEEPTEVFFDRPFLYMIMDMDRELPLFIGIMDNPNE